MNCKIKQKETVNPQVIDMNIIPTDQLCLLCRLAIAHWRNQDHASSSTEQFKNVSCLNFDINLKNSDNIYLHCRNC